MKGKKKQIFNAGRFFLDLLGLLARHDILWSLTNFTEEDLGFADVWKNMQDKTRSLEELRLQKLAYKGQCHKDKANACVSATTRVMV